MRRTTGGELRRNITALLVFGLMVSPVRLCGQERPAPWPTSQEQKATFPLIPQVPEEYGENHISRMAIHGMLAGAAAMTLGWYAGLELTGVGEGGILLGGILMSAAIPVGAHSGNDGRGELPLALVASYGVGLLGILSVGSSWNESAIRNRAIVVPLAQLATSIWVITKGIE